MRIFNLGKLDQENTEVLSAQATILDPKMNYTIEDKHVSIISVTCRKKTRFTSKHKTSSLNECLKPKLQIQYRSKMATHKIDIKYYMASITRSQSQHSSTVSSTSKGESGRSSKCNVRNISYTVVTSSTLTKDIRWKPSTWCKM